MLQIQPTSTEAIRMQTYGSPPNQARMLAEKPFNQNDHDTIVSITSGRKNLESTAFIMTPGNKLPKAEEIEKMIQSNGYPFKTDLYKAIANIIEKDMN